MIDHALHNSNSLEVLKSLYSQANLHLSNNYGRKSLNNILDKCFYSVTNNTEGNLIKILDYLLDNNIINSTNSLKNFDIIMLGLIKRGHKDV